MRRSWRAALWRAAVTSMLATASAGAQAWCDSQGATVQGCSLRLERGHLYRGALGETVAIAEPYAPLPLARFLASDSASVLALRYQRHARVSGTMKLIGDASFLVGAFAYSARRRNETGLRIALAGAVLHVASFPIGLRATREAKAAIAIHNAALRAP